MTVSTASKAAAIRAASFAGDRAIVDNTRTLVVLHVFNDHSTRDIFGRSLYPFLHLRVRLYHECSLAWSERLCVQWGLKPPTLC
jgi:hypothetical protein